MTLAVIILSVVLAALFFTLWLTIRFSREIPIHQTFDELWFEKQNHLPTPQLSPY